MKSPLRLTSPGILLILAVVAAGGIFLLDAFYLSPLARSHRADALRDQANRLQRQARFQLTAGEDLLQIAAENCAKSREHASPESDADLLGRGCRSLLRKQADFAWISQGNTIIAAETLGAEQLPASDLADMLQTEEPRQILDQRSGVTVLGDRLLLFGKANLPAGENQPPMQLWLARTVDSVLLDEMGTAMDAELVFVRDPDLPESTLPDSATRRAIWTIGKDELAVAWLEYGPVGKPIGYYRATAPVTQVSRQAIAGRRMVLIVLALSSGLVLLVILGSHMLVTGPVVRLLRRIQEVESGSAELGKLSDDLHGEPRVLARRLESAFDRLAYISKTDELTGLANRRNFEEVLKSFYHQARRYNRNLSLIIMDIDFFKAINDTGGHQAGDEMLKFVGRAIEQASRRADLPARLGGDEFAILLPETAAEEARTVANRVRHSISDRQIHAGNLDLNVTCSIGISDLNSGEITDPEGMLGLADKALYTAKEMGRNRTVLAHDLQPASLPKDSSDDHQMQMLSKKLAGLNTQFKGLFVEAVEQLVDILRLRDPHMANHARKVCHYALLITEEMGLPERVRRRMEISAMLHDIGMLAMPDSILLSKDRLTEAQMETMRSHPLLSVRIMEGMHFLDQEIPAVRYHHERFDGKGYPEGLVNSTIPLSARILTVADSLDAMTSTRNHRSAKRRVEAVREIQLGAGTRYDPAVVEALTKVAEKMGDRLLEIEGMQTVNDQGRAVPVDDTDQLHPATA
ncbi:MAG: diguanylate cyclase [Phycisphaerae bacterium]